MIHVRAFVCGVAAALGAFTLERQVFTQRSVPPIHACAAADGTLRLIEPAVPCEPGERRMRLKPPRAEDEPNCAEDDRRLANLQRRLADLEARDRRGTRRGRRAVAPFEVVSRKGGRLLHIDEQNVTFYNDAGRPVVWVLSDASGGLLVTQSTAGPSASIGALDRRANVRIQENEQDRIDLGRQVNGRYGLFVYGTTPNKIVAGLGQSQAGSGIVAVADTSDRFAARLYATDAAGGRLDVLTSKGTAVGFLETGEAGAGLLRLTDASGQMMVEAGLSDGVGLVHAGPGIYHSGVGILGLAPSFVIGKKR